MKLYAQVMVPFLGNFLGRTPRVRIERRSTRSAEWVERTFSQAAPAEVTSKWVGPYNVLALTLRIGQSKRTVTFGDSVTLLSTNDVVSAVNEEFPGLASNVAGKVHFETALSGIDQEIEIYASQTANSLGMAPGVYRGDTEHVSAAYLTRFIDYDDEDLGPDYEYRATLVDESDLLIETACIAEQVRNWKYPSTDYCLLHHHFIRFDGQPDEGKYVSVWGDFSIDGFSPGYVKYNADADGLVCFPVKKGSRVTIAIEDCTGAREIAIPDQDAADFWDIASSTPDPFTPQYPSIFPPLALEG